MDVSQCRGIQIGHTCQALCDANTGYTGEPTRYTCGGDGESWGWIADTTYPVCTSSHGQQPPPPPANEPGGQPEHVDFVHPIVNVIGTGSLNTGMDGYSTFQLAIAFSSEDVANVYAIFVSSNVHQFLSGQMLTRCLRDWFVEPNYIGPCLCLCICRQRRLSLLGLRPGRLPPR